MTTPTKLLSIVLQTPGCLPPFLWGDFGVGKTSQALQMAEHLGWDVEMLRPGERGEGALGVVPVPVEGGDVLKYPWPDWAARLASSMKPALVFLDECSSTPPALQPAIMGLALDGIIGGRRLPAHVKRAAAGNPVDQAAGGWELAPALANRFVHLDWPCPEANAWCSWLAGQDAGAQIVTWDEADWEREWGNARALGAAFILSHPSSLKEDVAKVLGRTPPAYATPRTWESCLRLLASCRAANCIDLYPSLAQGAVGPAMALEGASGDPTGAWLVWLRDNDLPDPETLLKDANLLEHDPQRPDRTYATLFAVAEAGLAQVNGKKLGPAQRADRWERAWKVLEKGLVLKLGKDTVLLPALTLADKGRRPNCTIGPAAHKVLNVLNLFVDLFKM